MANAKDVYTIGQKIEGIGAFIGAAIDGTLHSNEAPNAIKALGKNIRAGLAPVEFASRWAHTPGSTFTESMADTFLKQKNYKTVKNAAGEAVKELDVAWGDIDKRKVIGGISGIGIATGVVGGLTHDTAGNVDIAGLPGI